MSDKQLTFLDRAEATRQVAEAIKGWGMSEVTDDVANPTILHVTLRSPMSSRTFIATISIVEAKEV